MKEFEFNYWKDDYSISYNSQFEQLEIFDDSRGVMIAEVNLVAKIEDLPKIANIVNTFILAYVETDQYHREMIDGLKKNLEKRLIKFHKPLEK